MDRYTVVVQSTHIYTVPNMYRPSLQLLQFGIHSIVCFPFISDSFVPFYFFQFRSHHLYKEYEFMLVLMLIFFSVFSIHFWYFLLLFLVHFHLNREREKDLFDSHSLSIWFDSFVLLLVSISRKIPFIWPRLTYLRCEIMFKWWKKIRVVFVRRCTTQMERIV